MKKLTLFAAACAALLATASAHAAGTGRPTVTLNFLEIQTGFAANIPADQAPKLGDRIWSESKLYRWNGDKRGALLGHADSTGVFLTADAFQITAVASLPGGTLTVVGQSGNQSTSTFPIVGGTGRYATARGEVVIRSLGGPNSNMSADTVRLWD